MYTISLSQSWVSSKKIRTKKNKPQKTIIDRSASTCSSLNNFFKTVMYKSDTFHLYKA